MCKKLFQEQQASRPLRTHAVLVNGGVGFGCSNDGFQRSFHAQMSVHPLTEKIERAHGTWLKLVLAQVFYSGIGTQHTDCSFVLWSSLPQPYEFMPCAHHVDPGASGYPSCSSDEYPTPACRSECSEEDFGGGTYEEDKKMATEAYSLRVRGIYA